MQSGAPRPTYGLPPTSDMPSLPMPRLDQPPAPAPVEKATACSRGGAAAMGAGGGGNVSSRAFSAHEGRGGLVRVERGRPVAWT